MHFLYRQALFYAIGLVFTPPAIAKLFTEGSSKVPRQEQSSQFVRRMYHGSFVLGNTLYIDGGIETILMEGSVESTMLNTTLAIDLSSSFTTTSKDNGVQIQSINKGSCPSFNYIRFWTYAAANTAYAYGGEYSYSYPTVPPEALWSFTPSADTGTWQNVPQSDPAFNNITRPTEGSATSGVIGGFNLGGYAGKHGSEKTDIPGFIPIPGLQFYNFTSREWSNFSATAYTPDGTAEYSGTAYVPTWGSAGLLVMFGGQTSLSLSHFIDGEAYLSMSNISLFDPSTQSWFYQNSTGDVPSLRDRFCVVGINGGDNSTYEIFVYGGQKADGIYDGSTASQERNAGMDEVYVLSLPSFVWFKANYTSSDPREGHTCHVVGNRQMLSIGGLNPSAVDHTAAINEADPFWEGMKVFDLTAMQWTNYFNATASPYLTPSVVTAHYAAGSRFPSAWSSDDLENLFVKPTVNDSTSRNSTAGPRRIESPRRKSHTGSAVGGAVGGVAAGVLVGLALYCVARRRKPPRIRGPNPRTLSPTAVNNHPDPGKVFHEAGPAYPQEMGHWLPGEMDSWQDFTHEADSGHIFELMDHLNVHHTTVHEM